MSSLEAIRHKQNLKPQLAVALVLVLVVGAVVYFQGATPEKDQITVAAGSDSVPTINQASIGTQATTSTVLSVNPLAQSSETLLDVTTTIEGETTTSAEEAKQKPVGYPPSAKRTQCQSYYGSGVANVAFAPEDTNEASAPEEPSATATSTTEEPSTTATPTTEEPTTAAPTAEKSTTTATPTTEEPTTTAAPATEKPATTNPHPSDWVDAGHGVYVPKVLHVIACCESNFNPTAANAYSSARGTYQFLTGSWAAYGHKDRYGVAQAHLASPAQQDEAALLTWEKDGTRPWNASKACWGQNPV